MIVSHAQFPGSTVVMATEADTVNAETSSIEQLVNEVAFELGIQSLKPKQCEDQIKYSSTSL